MKYEPVIGLEVHVELSTKSKVFCGCSTRFGRPPNSQTCPVCLGLPGVLPVLNETAFRYAIKAALALNCKISEFIKFDRKNYFYPDLPKNFQISQYDKPLSYGGYLDIPLPGGWKKIGITRVHLEEDAGKLIHKENSSLVDFNRTGIPLLEIVSEPDLKSPEEARTYLITLKRILLYLEVSDCNMEEGSLRCDANISVKSPGSRKLGVKAELKNMNSFKAVRDALDFEFKRQSQILKEGGKVVQETRLWNEETKETISMRSKEEAYDYRYFPEPDLVPFVIDAKTVEEIKRDLPEFPEQRKERLHNVYKASGITLYDAGFLTDDKKMADYFEECIKFYDNPKKISNWLLSEVMAELNDRNQTIEQLGLPARNLTGMIKMIDDGVITGKVAKELLREMIKTGKTPKEIVEEKGLLQMKDEGEIEKIIEGVMAENQEAVDDYKKGKGNAVMYLVGQTMKATRGKANPGLVNKILRKKLKNIS